MSDEIAPRPTHTVLVSKPAPEAPPERSRDMGIRASMTAGLVIVGVFVGGFGTWAAVAPLESAAIAPGIIGVSTERRTVQHMEGGIVDEILVVDGDQVTAGQTLIVFDDTASRALLDLLEGQYRSAVTLNARLEAERDGRSAIRWPDWLLAEVAAEAEAGGDAAQVMATQERIFRARAVSLANQRAIYQRRIEQLREEAAGLEGELETQDRRRALLAEELEGVRELVARGLEPKPRLLEMERAETQIVGDSVRNQARIASIGRTIDETRLVIDELGNVQLAEVVAELREVETRLSDLRERLAAARDVAERTRVTAPVAGTVMDLQVFTQGGVVAAGQRLMDVVPANDRLIIEARVAPNDIETIALGLPAQVRLTAYSQLGAPRLTGHVFRISADRLADPRTGASWYEARIALDPDQPGLSSLALVPGMPAEVMIVTGARTPIDYLLKPIVDSLGRALREE
jgi:HlyD family type I secretion membrane fusion protein